MRANLAAVRRRVDRLAVSMLKIRDVSKLTDAEFDAELRMLMARLGPCTVCGYNIAAHNRDAMRVLREYVPDGSAVPLILYHFRR